MSEQSQERAFRRMQMVLALRYLHGLTLEEVGERLGCTRERVRQIESAALRVFRSKPELMEKIRELLRELDASRPLPPDTYL